jgi:hypothetical protein
MIQTYEKECVHKTHCPSCKMALFYLCDANPSF